MEIQPAGKGCTVYRRRCALPARCSDLYQERTRGRASPVQTATVVETRPRILMQTLSASRTHKEKLGGIRRLAGQSSLRNIHCSGACWMHDEGIILPKKCGVGPHIKNVDEHGKQGVTTSSSENKRGYKVTIEGLSEKSTKSIGNYAKLIFRCIALPHAYRAGHQLVGSLQLDSEKHQHLEERCGTRPEEIHPGRHGSQRQNAPNCGNENTGLPKKGCLIGRRRAGSLPAVDNPPSSTAIASVCA